MHVDQSREWFCLVITGSQDALQKDGLDDDLMRKISTKDTSQNYKHGDKNRAKD